MKNLNSLYRKNEMLSKGDYMKKKKEILLDLKALRFDYHARLVLAEGEEQKEKIREVLALFDELNDRIEELEER